MKYFYSFHFPKKYYTCNISGVKLQKWKNFYPAHLRRNFARSARVHFQSCILVSIELLLNCIMSKWTRTTDRTSVDYNKMPIRVKDHSKCNEWERRRRDRLNDAFKNLAQLLPHYDPARIPAKIDILEKSTEFVKELRLSNSRLLSNQAETDEKCMLILYLNAEILFQW